MITEPSLDHFLVYLITNCSIYDNSEVHWNYRQPDMPLTRACKSFLDGVEKLRPLIEEKGIKW